MQANLVLQHLNLLFIDNDINVTADAYALFSPIFKSVTLAHNSERAMEAFNSSAIDIIMTDIEMPNEDGLSFVAKIRDVDADLPIIVLSAFSEHNYLYRAANLRLDGYLIKPLSFKKLNPLFDKIAARLQHKLSDVHISPAVYYDMLNGLLYVDGNIISLGKKERSLLVLLLTNPSRVVSKNMIQKTIWPDGDMSDSALKNLLGELRKKLTYELIKNIPSQGWLLELRTATVD